MIKIELLFSCGIVSRQQFFMLYFFTNIFFRMLIQENGLSWLSAAATFDNEEENLGRSLENKGEYIGKKLSTNAAVPGRLCRDTKYAEFYKEV